MNGSGFTKRKLTALLIVGGLLLAIYAKNLLERKSFEGMSNTFKEVYNDRLIVEGYIFQISEHLFTIQKLIDHCQLSANHDDVIPQIMDNEKSILSIVDSFEKTKLTAQEKAYLSDFKSIIVNDLNIQDYTLIYTDSAGVNTTQVRKYDEKISLAQQDLDGLSKIQLDEGEKLINKANIVINRSKLWSQFEVALLFILAISIYLLLFRGKFQLPSSDS
ncbi:MCP four helix bundle domain-containing protein [Algoriphagus halophytocola]|uniref:MCP four helix bundle domain-containing protein n=1 Tax=Algoriphagus halophytocola TaxID=2991499 RepID=A0ABY6MEP3_9BACT|nr:MCP four helix bundle domain-containing protein [Algoriphagus sp. TR-M5]UZD22251.1 MCP four helix bundle domain-containing protein [Algoriphagus sp. TR-M5]